MTTVADILIDSKARFLGPFVVLETNYLDSQFCCCSRLARYEPTPSKRLVSQTRIAQQPVVDEGWEDPNTTISEPSSARQRNDI